MADKVPDENKREGSDDLQEPANKKPRDDAGPSQGPKPVENFQDVGDRSMPECPIKDCDWKICNLSSDEVANEVSSFLKKYYSVYGGSWGRIFNEDNKVKYEYQYSKDYLLWLLSPSDFGMDWNIVVQDKYTKELVAFIAAVPKHLKRYVKEVHYQSDKDDHVSDEDDHVSDKDDHVSGEDDHVSDGYDTVSDEKDEIKTDYYDILIAEVKFLCVLPRCEELEPHLLKEMARRVKSEDANRLMFESINHFTPEHKVLRTCQCWSRPLNIKKLTDLKFIELAKEKTVEATQVEYDDLLRSPAPTYVLRKMEVEDVRSVTTFLEMNLDGKLTPVPTFSELEVEHWFLPREGIVESYVAESENNAITHFISFSTLSISISIVEKNDSIVNSNDSSVGSNSISNDSIVEENDSNGPIVEEEVSTITLKAVRLLYNVSTEGEPHELLKKALRFANIKGYDFFEVPNIMNIRDQVLKDLKFREYGQYYFARLHKKLEPKQVSFTARSLAPEK